jgi:hypothetical protein
MIKKMVIRPLVIATEKVVEYYFPEEIQKNPDVLKTDIKKLYRGIKHSGPGSTSKTAIDDQSSNIGGDHLSSDI